MDAVIYGDFRETFPNLKIDVIDVDRMTTERPTPAPPAASTAGAGSGGGGGGGGAATEGKRAMGTTGTTVSNAGGGGDKSLWRAFCMRYENELNDFNSGTLLRIDARSDYQPENTTVGRCGVCRYLSVYDCQ